jgi:hypothetical protein
MAMAVALFAITLNFLQPLVHAAAMRDGAPSTLWTVFCNSTAGDPDGKSGSLPTAARQHECCLGLAHGTALAVPPTGFVLVEPAVAARSAATRSRQPTPRHPRDREPHGYRSSPDKPFAETALVPMRLAARRSRCLPRRFPCCRFERQ